MRVNLENVGLLLNEKIFNKEDCLDILEHVGPIKESPLQPGGNFIDRIAKDNELIFQVWKNVLSRSEFSESELLEYAIKSNCHDIVLIVIADLRVSWRKAKKYAIERGDRMLLQALVSRADAPINEAIYLAFAKRNTDLFEILFAKEGFKALSAANAFSYAEHFDDFVLWREVFKNNERYLLEIELEKALRYAEKISNAEAWMIVLGREDLESNRALELADKQGDRDGKIAWVVLNRPGVSIETSVYWAKKWDRGDTFLKLVKRPDVEVWLQQ